mmetsp:Transcript_14338/g.20189  ORF Transcript_14338/g.20189 Transcript_14338/m.20189 type:complete len:114 (+) Transcript_14338:1-342(+)
MRSCSTWGAEAKDNERNRKSNQSEGAEDDNEPRNGEKRTCKHCSDCNMTNHDTTDCTKKGGAKCKGNGSNVNLNKEQLQAVFQHSNAAGKDSKKVKKREVKSTENDTKDHAAA